jgi:hypothetical protein
MKNRINFRKLGRTSSHRKAMFRNMVTSLIDHERIRTTLAKAKEMRRIADRVVGWAKTGPRGQRVRGLTLGGVHYTGGFLTCRHAAVPAEGAWLCAHTRGSPKAV